MTTEFKNHDAAFDAVHDLVHSFFTSGTNLIAVQSGLFAQYVYMMGISVSNNPELYFLTNTKKASIVIPSLIKKVQEVSISLPAYNLSTEDKENITVLNMVRNMCEDLSTINPTDEDTTKVSDEFTNLLNRFEGFSSTYLASIFLYFFTRLSMLSKFIEAEDFIKIEHDWEDIFDKIYQDELLNEQNQATIH